MPASLQKFHYHVAEDAGTDNGRAAGSPESYLGGAASEMDEAPALSFNSNEAAARFYLDQLLQADDRPEMLSVVEPDRPERVPGLRVESEQDVGALGTHQLRFTQTHQNIPIFGANAVVELTEARDLVSVTAALDEVSGVDAVESLSRTEALVRVAEFTDTNIPPESAVSGRLNFYKAEETGDWHLAWFFTELPAAPPVPDETDFEPMPSPGLGQRPIPASYNYLVDAHNGDILFYYTAVPTVLPTPAQCKGTDENEEVQSFFGALVSATGTACRLNDPLRTVRTFDLKFGDIDQNPPLPTNPVEAPSNDYGTANRAAVSAHVNASRVQDFYKVVLQRDGIDDKGMELLSLVNVTSTSMGQPPALLNAFWWRNKMWYGQIQRNGRLVSLSRYLDIIGHELTHGVIASTSGLVYATESGALNESYADVAGIIINNWYTAPDPNDVATWDWELGSDLRTNGDPLRDFSNPARLGYPAHMNGFMRLQPGVPPHPSNDHGFVHFNSNIHNKAVHNLLTIANNGARVFSVQDVAVLTYLGMARLTPLATFSEALQSTIDVAQTYFGGSVDKTAKIAAIRQAYQLVGIT